MSAAMDRAGLGNKEAAGSFTGEIGVTKAGPGNKEAAGSSTGVSKAGPGNKEASCTELPATSCVKLPEGSEPAVALVTHERVPDSFIERIKARPMRRAPPLRDAIARGDPNVREKYLTAHAMIDYMVDLKQDCLRQHAEKGYAEIGVYYTDGVRRICILPNQVG